MMHLKFALFSSLFLSACGSNSPTTQSANSYTSPPVAEASQFDPALAAELRADEYGMGKYVIAFLKAGPNRTQTAQEAAALQRAHLENIHRLANEGKLVLAGPFLDEGEVRGLYVFDVQSVEEAAELTASDPAIVAGRLTMELRPWFGSAALRQVNGTHERIAKEKF